MNARAIALSVFGLDIAIIRALRGEAASAGDSATVADCDLIIDMGPNGEPDDSACRRVEQAIADARAQG
jgi:hypothetical protein